MEIIDTFATKMMIELVDYDKGVGKNIAVQDGYSFVFGGIATIRFSLVLLWQPYFEVRYVDFVIFG